MPKRPDRTLLVVGTNGFVGGSIARFFREAGRSLVTSSHRRPADVVFDFNETGQLAARAAKLGVTDAVICSGIADIDRCMREREYTWNFNVTRTCALIEDLHGVGIGAIFCSSDMVFAGDRGGYCETDQASPVTEYGRQKVAVEEFLRAKTGTNAVLRMSKLYGLVPAGGSVVHQMLAALRAGPSLRAATDQTIVPTAVEDVARTLMAIIDRELTGVIHVSPLTRYSRYEFVDRIAQAAGLKDKVVACSIDEFSFLDKRPKDLWLNGARSRASTGVDPLELVDVLGGIVARATTPVTGSAPS